MLVRPIYTSITPYCVQQTGIVPEAVQEAGTFESALQTLHDDIYTHVFAQGQKPTFVALNAAELRMQLCREAQDKNVKLPVYLDMPRIFDLRTEYSKWQMRHPGSAAAYPGTSVANICAGMGLGVPRAPVSAETEMAACTQILRQLVSKSQPAGDFAGDFADVLTRPTDVEADVAAFVSEQSKVVFLSGLPTDVVQSDIESWFATRGIRPSTLWTLRSSDPHRQLDVGFAVFATHNEARDALSMAGRTIGDRLLDVLPSSPRVLEHAQDVLIPFPAARNRPRPGDWMCPACGFSNFQRRTACFRCSYPTGAPNATGPFAAGKSATMPMRNQGRGQFNHAPNNRVTGQAPPGSSNGGQHVPFRAGDWKCGNDGCFYHNFAKNLTCLRCGSSRGNAAYVGESHNSYHGRTHSGGPLNNTGFPGYRAPLPSAGPPVFGAAGQYPNGYNTYVSGISLS